MFEIKEVTNQQEWEDFLRAQHRTPFLQSWKTGCQYKAMGDQTWKIGIYREGRLFGVALVILTRAKRGHYLYLPYGPVFQEWSESALGELTEYLKSRGREEGFDFIRIAPYLEKTQKTELMFSSAGYRVSPIHMLAEVLWVLDITPSEEDLLKGMRKTTRNLIRRGIKDGIQIEQETSKEGVQKFISLHDHTKKRHSFVAYPDKLFYQQVEQFKDSDETIVWKGSHENKLIAAAIMMYFGDTASYHHGASIPSKAPVSYLIQWSSILEAKKRGMKEYNFWGIVETDDKKHPFYGITRYKQGFGGRVRYLLPAQDYPLTKKYWLTYIVESIRRIKRGFGFKRV